MLEDYNAPGRYRPGTSAGARESGNPPERGVGHLGGPPVFTPFSHRGGRHVSRPQDFAPAALGPRPRRPATAPVFHRPLP